MTRRVLQTLALVAVGAIFALGCGGGDDDDSADGGSGATTTAAAPAAASTSETTTSAVDIPDNIDEAIELCKSSVNGSGLSESAKDRLLELCDKARDDPEEAEKAAREACEEIAKSLPAGELRDAAEAACKKQ